MNWIDNPITEQYAARARVLGLSEVEAQQIDRCARAIGPRTTLGNSEVYNAVWTLALHRASRGEPRDFSDPSRAAVELFQWMYGREPMPWPEDMQVVFMLADGWRAALVSLW